MTPADAATILDAEARGWLLDCNADPDYLDGLTAAEVRYLVDRHYAGGWSAFVADAAELVTP